MCLPAFAGQNPDIQIFLEFEDGSNYLEPPPYSVFPVYVCFTSFGDGGGLLAASLKLDRTFSGTKLGHEDFLPGGVSTGDPEVDGWVFTGSSCTLPDVDGVLVAGRIDYYYTGTPGTISIVPGDLSPRETVDCYTDTDYWCVRNSPSGNAGVWMPPPPGECDGPTTWHVDDSNTGFEDGSAANPFNTIQEGVDAAANGDTVLVHPGTYADADTCYYLGVSTVANVCIDKNIVVKSSDGPWVTTIDGLGVTATGVVCLPDTAGNPGTSRPRIQGFTIEDQLYAGVRAVYCDVIGNVISNQGTGVSTYNEFGPVSHGEQSPMWSGFAPPYIADNTIAATNHGLYLGHGPDSRTVAIVEGNTIIGGTYGVYGWQPDWGTATRHIELLDNEIAGCERGVRATDGSYGPDTELVLHGNWIHDNTMSNVSLSGAGWQTSWDVDLGGSLVDANNLYASPINLTCNVGQGSVDISHNYWGTVNCDSILAWISGSYDSLYPFTNMGHTELYYESYCDLPHVWHVDDSNIGHEDGTPELPFRTIQKGVDIAANGDTVLVHPGIYDDARPFEYYGVSTFANVFVDKNIVLMSSDGPEVTAIDGQDLAETGVVCMPDTADASGACRPAVLGFTIEGQLQTGVRAICCDVLGNEIIDQSVGISTFAEFGPVAHGDEPDLNWWSYGAPYISGNFIVATDQGIYLGPGPDSRTVAVVDGNVIGGSTYGVYSYQPDWGSDTRHIELVGNQISGCSTGVRIRDSSYGPDTEVILRGNEISGNSARNVSLSSPAWETSWSVEVGGSLANANDFYDSPLNLYMSFFGQSDLSHNYWGTVDCDSVCARVYGPCDSLYPFTNSAHTDLYYESDCDLPRVWHVDDSNSGHEDGTAELPFNTIQEGVDIAANGDTVRVHPGIYDESYWFNFLQDGGTATALIDKNIVLESSDGPSVTLIHGWDSTDYGVVCMPDTSIGLALPPPLVRGFTFWDQTEAGVVAIYSRVHGNGFSGQPTGVSNYATAYPQDLAWTIYDPTHIADNEISAIEYGIRVGPGPDARTAGVIESNTISGSDFGVLSGAPGWLDRRIELVGNVISGCERGVSISDGSAGPTTEVVLRRNELYDNSVVNVTLSSGTEGCSFWDVDAGGSLEEANDFYGAPLNMDCDVSGDLDLTHNYWGSTDCETVLTTVTGIYDSLFPFTSDDHTELYDFDQCGPLVRGYCACSTTDSYYSFGLHTCAILSTGGFPEEGGTPWEATMRPGGQEVWFTGRSGDGVVVVNTSADTISHVIPDVGNGPRSIAFTLDDSRAIVSCTVDSHVVTINTADYSVESSFKLYDDPGNLALDPTTGNLYMLNLYGTRLYEIAPDGSAVLRSASLSPGGGAWQLVVDPAGERIYLTDAGGDQIVVVDRATLAVTATVPVGDDPRGIDVTADGTKLVVACDLGGTIWCVDTGDYSTVSRTIPGSRPVDVDILDATSQAFVACRDEMIVIDLPSLSTYTSVDGGCAGISHVAVQPQVSSLGTGSEEPTDEGLPLPDLHCVPNPFGDETTIRYSMRLPGDVTVAVYDVRGRLVVPLEQARRSEGVHEVVWRGKDARGRDVAAGVYFVRVSIGDDVRTGKLLFVK
jgi:YVTN family beta-propeller protein